MRYSERNRCKDDKFTLPIYSSGVGKLLNNANKIRQKHATCQMNPDTINQHFKNDDDQASRSNLLTVQEVASLLRISRYSIYNLVKRGKLPAIWVLNKLRFNQACVEEYLNKQRVKVEKGAE